MSSPGAAAAAAVAAGIGATVRDVAGRVASAAKSAAAQRLTAPLLSAMGGGAAKPSHSAAAGTGVASASASVSASSSGRALVAARLGKARDATVALLSGGVASTAAYLYLSRRVWTAADSADTELRAAATEATISDAGHGQRQRLRAASEGAEADAPPPPPSLLSRSADVVLRSRLPHAQVHFEERLRREAALRWNAAVDEALEAANRFSWVRAEQYSIESWRRVYRFIAERTDSTRSRDVHEAADIGRGTQSSSSSS